MSETLSVKRPGWWKLAWIAGPLGLTGYLSGVTLWTVLTAKSEVPWRDQWVFLDDVRSILAGAHVLHTLWYPHWGHRHLITRLVIWFDVRFLSGLNTPLIDASLVLQAAHTAMFCYVAWRLLRRAPAWVYLLVMTVTIQLAFCPLQLENLIWAPQLVFKHAGEAASAAFCLLALYAAQEGRAGVKGRIMLGGCGLAAVVSTLARPDGIFVWPVLFVQAVVLRLSKRVRWVLALAGCSLAVLYFWGYDAGPAMGMGVRRAVLHPEQSLPLLGMLAVGPLSVISPFWGTWLGSAALLVIFYALVRAFRASSQPPAMLTVYGAVAVFSLLSLSAIVAGRLSPEFVAAREEAHLDVLPSRYFTTVFFFWAAVSGIAIWLVIQNRRTWPQLAVLGSVTLALAFGTVFQQVSEAAKWRAYMRKLDVASTALIVDVADRDNSSLREIFPDEELRSRVRDWLQENGLSVFHEQRAQRLGQRISSGSDIIEPERCRGAAETVLAVNDDTWRATGWSWDDQEEQPPLDLVFANTSGVVVGLARSGLERRDLGGKIPQRDLERAGWQGYFRAPVAGPIELFAVLPQEGHYCRIAEISWTPQEDASSP